MWGNVTIEANLQSNFNIGFTNTKTDILIHLTQWQYWWWFWFSFLWAFYYLTILKIVRFRTLKFRPRIATTLRPHGKWGDLIICIIPVSWCANIISNSNFILRMIEWQSEASLLTVRIRGKQWYWVYKFELKTFTDVLTVPKNIGRNKWQISTPGDLQVADDYLHILQLRAQNKWVKNYWSDMVKKTSKTKNFHLISPQEQLRYDFFKTYDSNLSKNLMNVNNLYRVFNRVDGTRFNEFNNIFNFTKGSSWNSLVLRSNNKKASWEDFSSLNTKFSNFTKNDELFLDRKEQVSLKNLNFQNLNFKNDNLYSSILYNYNDFTEVTRFSKRSQGTNSPVRLIKYPISNKTNFDFNADVLEIFRFRFNDGEPTAKQKPLPHSTFLTMKQKRYKRKKIVLPRTIFYKNQITGERTKDVKHSAYPYLHQNKIILHNFDTATRQYRMFRKNKVRHELTNLALSKRMLRTRRTLVLPAHVNITTVTNSYDVIHSWFIPGLGIKMDCIPGRATHHTFYIDNVGFYYGQCAEICGRYHHHMPIRICALPFEQFLLWWQTFGLPKLLFTKNFKRYEYHYGFRKYVW
jgi:Heme/copper-type cytochrome/quinol oxidases, subunit 2